MTPFKKILVPVDFSAPSRKALSYALTLADQFKAKLILAHVVPVAAAIPYAFPIDSFELERSQVETATREINDLVPREHRDRFDIQAIVKIGIVEDELLEIVKDDRVDLVVMGTHGRRKLSRWFIGSVTEHILRKVPVPVLTVSHLDEEHTVGLVSLKRILYGTDLSETSDSGLKHAVELARATGAELTILHAVYYWDRPLWARGGIPGFEEMRSSLVKAMRQKVESVVPPDASKQLSTEFLVVEGKPFEAILDVAKNQSADIVVLNLQSKTTLERALIGSTAERVARLAELPVLFVPPAIS
jgi:nucleotide-binding universal stress UspA family protein